MRLLAKASRTADICVFTITDDRVSDAILDAHRRAVAVRIITDDAKKVEFATSRHSGSTGDPAGD